MTKNKGNTLSDLSKKWMEESLIALMREKPYSAITIKEITDTAGLSRRTFYRNFDTKDDILVGHFNVIWDDYRQALLNESQLDLPTIARVFFTVMQDHLSFLSLLNHQGLTSLILSKVDELLPEDFQQSKGQTIDLPQESIAYGLAFSTGGFMRILIKWLDEGAEKSPDEMAGLVSDFIKISQHS